METEQLQAGVAVRYVGPWRRIERRGLDNGWATLSGGTGAGVVLRAGLDHTPLVLVEFPNYSPVLEAWIRPEELELA